MSDIEHGQFAADILEEFGQSVTITFADSSTRVILAVITYKDNGNYGPHARGPVAEITVANTETTGIRNDELSPLKDKITMPMRDGTTQTRTIQRRLTVNAETIKLEVR